MDRIYKLAKKIKNDSIAIKKDYDEDYISREFHDGILIGYKIVLEDIEDLWSMDLSDYKVDW